MIVEPSTGVVLDDELDVLVGWEAKVDSFLRRLSPFYGFRGDLRERIAELRGPATMPKARWRSDKQARIAACPRCGAKT